MRLCIRLIVLISALLVVSPLVAQTVYDLYPPQNGESTTPTTSTTTQPAQHTNTTDVPQKTSKEKKTSHKILTGFSGGMMLHCGYAFANSPDELFHNGHLQDKNNLACDGVTLGIGGSLRLNLIQHIHLGAEGAISEMPLSKTGSSTRSGWGGVLCDYYGTVGKVQLFAGGIIGGGSCKRLYVPSATEGNATYNASFTKTPFFMLDPYVGMEFAVHKGISVMLKLDYLLPFGDGQRGLNTETVRWSNFLSPSGPRLYIGFMFGHQAKR